MLKPEGVVGTLIQTASSLEFRFSQAKWRHLNREHLQLLSKAGIRLFLEKHGFQMRYPIHACQLTHPFLTGRLLVYCTKKKTE